MQNKSKKVNIIIITILVIPLLVSLTFNVFLMNKYKSYVKATRTYSCIKKYKTESALLSEIEEKSLIAVDINGKIISTSNSSTYFYLDESKYKDAKDSYKDSKNITFNDNNISIKEKTKSTEFKNSNNEDIPMWYHTHLEYLQTLDYVCTILE